MVLAALLCAAAAPAGAATSRADLKMRNVAPGSSSVQRDAPFEASATVRNAGTKRARASTVGFYLSSDAVVDGDEPRVGEARAKSLKPGKRTSVTASLTAAAPAGTFTLIACADDSKEVRERSERNNCAVGGSLEVTGQAQPTPAPTPVNDPPVINLDAPTPLGYLEQAGFVNAFGPAASISDPDDTSLDFLRVAISSGFDSSFDELRLNPAVTGFLTGYSGGVLTVAKPGGTLAEYEQALRGIQFRNASDDPDHRQDGTPNPADAARTLSASGNDGAATGPTAVRSVTINPVNDLATVTTANSFIAFTEGDPDATLDPNLTVSDPDSATLSSAFVAFPGQTAGDTLSFSPGAPITGSIFNSTGLTLFGSGTTAEWQSALRTVAFRNTSITPTEGVRILSFRASDGGGLGASSAQTAVEVTPVNNDPVVTNLHGDTLSYVGGSGSQRLDQGSNATVVDDDSADFGGGTLTVEVTQNGSGAEDELGIVAGGGISVSGSFVKDGPDTFGVFGVDLDGLRLVVQLTSDATPARVSALIRQISFNTSDNPVSPSRSVDFTLEDGDGGSSNTASVAVAPF